jgi:hypothetical protein
MYNKVMEQTKYEVGDVVWVDLSRADRQLRYIGPAIIVQIFEEMKNYPYDINIPISFNRGQPWAIKEGEIKYLVK